MEGSLVEIRGVADKVVPEKFVLDELPKPAIDVNEKVGRVVAYNTEKGKYVVHLFDAVHVAIAEANLKPYEPAAPEDGGFDLAWPSSPEAYPEFAWNMSEVVQKKGWCLVQMIAPEETRLEAAKQVTNFSRCKPLKKEFVSDYLGHGGDGKVGFIDTEVPDASAASLKKDALSLFDRNLSNVAAVTAPIAMEAFDFTFGDRTKGMVWSPYGSSKESQAFKAEPLDDDAIEEGAISEHITFLQRRKLGLMTWLENGGGKITMIYKPDMNRDSVTLPLSTKKMLVFQSDRMTYQYEPEGPSAVLQAWIMSPKVEFQLSNITGDGQMKSDIMGIKKGRPLPEGDKVHIMCVHARLPGGGFGGEEYWSMLLEGTDGEVCIPFMRWDTDIYCTKEWEPHVFGKAYAQHGGFCRHEEIFNFDNKFFDISDSEAQNMNPSQRVFTEDGYTVLYRGGHTRESLSGQKIGVFIGDTGSDWSPFMNMVETKVNLGGQDLSIYGPHTGALTGSNNSVNCSRLSHILNLRGPIGTADTACSSSLVATGVMMMYMRPRELPENCEHMSGRIYESVCGGVCTQIGPGSYIAMCGLNMISPVGRCFTFDESGDGYARGEGVGLMYLKASDDLEDYYQQAAVMLGCTVNQDGRSASMTAPNGPSQQACIQSSMREAGLEARMINLAECHGTGTALGDPIEVGALRNVMEPRDMALCLTSSKSNIGHLEGGAGSAGLLKCILMLMAGTCPPNAHCRQLNPHLAVSGFPCFFDTEAIDTSMNSALTGVSSFGFGGTNGRSDIWGNAKFGVNATGQLKVEELDQLTITCPVTFGPIDHLTGEAVPAVTEERKKYVANCLREEFAPYDISSHAYTGGYRYRQTEVEEREDDLEGDDQIYVCGSWSGYKEMEEMEREEGGWYVCTMILGEARCESFYFCLNKNKYLTLYPAIDKAGPKIWVEGPSDAGKGRKWLIDGRDMEVAAGTVYQIHFKWNLNKHEVYWEEVGAGSADLALKYEHTYFVCSSSTKFKPLALVKSGDEEGVYTGTLHVGAQGREEFQIIRDKDKTQAIYPAKSRGTAPARGPDDLGEGKLFAVKGPPGTAYPVKLKIVDGHVVVTAGEKVWESVEGWERHTYSVLGSFNEGMPVEMSMDPLKPGVFSARVQGGENWLEEVGSYADFFQITVDDDVSKAWYPEAGGARSGEVIVRGPDGNGGGSTFLARSTMPGTVYDIVLDLTAEDHRKIVTFGLADAAAIQN